MKKYIFFAGLVLSCTALLGCQHTAEGFGKDMQSNGQAIQRSVDR